jgi:hypothetical protein
MATRKLHSTHNFATPLEFLKNQWCRTPPRGPCMPNLLVSIRRAYLPIPPQHAAALHRVSQSPEPISILFPKSLPHHAPPLIHLARASLLTQTIRDLPGPKLNTPALPPYRLSTLMSRAPRRLLRRTTSPRRDQTTMATTPFYEPRGFPSSLGPLSLTSSFPPASQSPHRHRVARCRWWGMGIELLCFSV